MANNIRRYKSKNHVTINNAIMKERDVSLKAKGLFALVMSLPDDWDFSIKGICAITKENYTAVNSAIHELIDAGYCRRQTVKENGKFVGCDYEFSEVKTGSPRLGFPHTENPHVENLNGNNINSTINSPLNDNISSINTPDKKEKEREFISKSRFQKPKIEEIESYIREKKMNFDASQFYDHYESNGWMVGRTHMKDWKAACRTWERKRMDKSQEEEEKEELPEGLDRQVWEKCREWFISRTPRISGYITPDVYLKIKGVAKDSRELADIILYIEASGYNGDIVKEFSRLKSTGEYKPSVVWTEGNS